MWRDHHPLEFPVSQKKDFHFGPQFSCGRKKPLRPRKCNKQSAMMMVKHKIVVVWLECGIGCLPDRRKSTLALR